MVQTKLEILSPMKVIKCIGDVVEYWTHKVGFSDQLVLSPKQIYCCSVQMREHSQLY